ncbi:MAG: MqnA/MqnD/SBP family protein [Bacteroidota bacterium]
MNIALWNTTPGTFWADAIGAAGAELSIIRADPARCDLALRAGEADIALVPTLTAMRDPDLYDIFPEVALSTWHYPFARIVMRNDLNAEAQSLAFDPRYTTEVLLARLILKEHYGMTPQFFPVDAEEPSWVLDIDADAALIVGDEVPYMRPESYAMDLGQEWYELANYPMVWGFFAARKGEATPEMMLALRAAASAAEQTREAAATDVSPELHHFISDDLRTRFDDLAVASLTEYRQYLFYENVLTDVPDLDPVSFPELDEAEAEEDDA